MQKFINILKDINELIVFKHSIFALPFIFTAMITASAQVNGTAWFGWKLLILGVLCAVSARNFAMAFNRYKDEDIDKLNPRTANRPSVDGRIGRTNLQIFIAANAVIFVLVAYLINELAFWLSFPILAVLGGYSLFKRFSELAHLVLGLSLGLAPIAGAVAVTGEIPLFSVLLCLGVMFWVAGFDLLYSLQDVKFDREHYAKFKEICLANYKNLALHYARRAPAGEFLAKFCDKDGKSYLPKHAQARAFVEHYYARYKAIGNELDESGEWEKWQASER